MLENKLSEVLKVTVEITIRSDKSFTVSFDGKNEKAVEAFESFMGDQIANVENVYDIECDMTCIFFDIK